MAPHEAASAGILTTSLVLIAFVGMYIVISTKDRNDRYVQSPSSGSVKPPSSAQSAQSAISSLFSSLSSEDIGEGKSSTKRHKKHRGNKRKSYKRK